jgi:hypothetical protein
MRPQIKFKSGYKYQLKKDYSVYIPIILQKEIITEYIKLNTDGILTIKEGYAWNGPTGPVITTLNFMRGSLIHDSLYQLMREEYLDHDTYRKTADKILYNTIIEDGMWNFRAWYIYQGTRLFGNPFADPKNKKPDIYAPK